MSRNQRSYTVQSILPAGSIVIVGLAGTPATPDLGNGGWSLAQRPKRVSATEWIGIDPITMQVPSLLDGFAHERSVERPLYRLESLLRQPTKATRQPAVLRLSGPIPFASPNIRWIMTGMDYGDQERRSDGARTRAFFTLSFTQYIPADVMIEAKADSPAQEAQERAAANGTTPAGRSYTVKAGDTLWKIAQHHLGNGARWTEIAELNNIRDPKTLQIGAVLRIP